MANTTLPNGTQYHTWKPEPLVRGTFSILSSSLLTMILCVWTSVHLNIPEHETDDVKAQTWRIAPQTRRKLGWMVIAIFAPEWVVLTAYRQHIAANEIGKTMRRAFGQPESPSLIKTLPTKLNLVWRWFSDNLKWTKIKTGPIEQVRQSFQQEDLELDLKPKRYPWTRAHSLYATMGGFVVDTRDLGLNYLPGGRQRMTLTLHGLKFLADHTPDILPDVPKSAIVDKSKANAFTKLVTCGQALWFGVQCTTRSAQGLSISLLEINTAAHALCTLLMYFLFWWHKPLDVEEPTILTDVDAHSVIAFLAISQQYPYVKWSPVDKEEDEHFDSTPDFDDAIIYLRSRHIRLKRSKDPKLSSPYYAVYHGFAIPFTTKHMNRYARFTDVDFERFQLASESAMKFKLRSTPLFTILRNEDYLKVRLRNQPKIFDTDSDAEWHSSLLGFPLAGLFYGAIHLLVWNRSFRGQTDELLWKISSLTILLSGIPFVFGIWCFAVLSEPVDELSPQRRRIYFLCKAITRPFFASFALFYIFCRTFIIVECFLDVFHLPDSAFDVPQWSQYFPHIG